MSPSERIFELIGKQKVRAADVARATGISLASFTDWKMGRTKPSYDARVKLASYFGVSIEYLSGETDDPTTTVNYDDDIEFIGQRARKLPPEQQAAFKTAMSAFLDALDAKNKSK